MTYIVSLIHSLYWQDDDGVIVVTSDFNSTNQTPLSKKRVFDRGFFHVFHIYKFNIDRDSKNQQAPIAMFDLNRLLIPG